MACQQRLAQGDGERMRLSPCFSNASRRSEPNHLALVMIALAVVVVSRLPAVLSAAELEASGPVTKVRDGDTIVVGDIPVRFDGVSAPELDEA